MSESVMDDYARQTKKHGKEAGTEATVSDPQAAPNDEVQKPAPKNIVVCCDGTGNEFAGKDSKDSNSNVVKLYTALDLNYSQFAYYHPGVGTLGDPTKSGIGRLWSQLKGLAFGNGFEDNVLDAYRYLMQHYNAGDKVYLIGFSRGSYTARALAGLLHGYGLLCRGNEGHIPYAWRMYTAQVQEQQRQQAHTIVPDFTFRDTFSHKDFMLHFVGLWDTVSSVGWVSEPLRLLHLAQNPTIPHGRHAISIDERRCFYQDNLWGPPVPVQIPPILRGTPREKEIPVMQDLLQVWFCGVHSDVGGSYPQLQSGLSNITLRWMLDEAEAAGIRLDPARRSVVLGEPPADDPQGVMAQLAPLYEKPTSSEIHKSLKGVWWLLELFPHRYFDTDDADEKMRIPLGACRRLPAGAIVHSSVIDRLQNDHRYRPGNLDLAELTEPAVNPPGTASDLTGFRQFTPQNRREGDLREKWIAVFLSSLLELAAGLFVLEHVLLWLIEGAIYLCSKVLPAAWLKWQRLDTGSLQSAAHAHTSPWLWWALANLWPLLLAVVILVARLLLKQMKKLRA